MSTRTTDAAARRGPASATRIGLSLLIAVALAAGLTGCSDDKKPVALTLVAYDSFALSKDTLAAFTTDTGIEVKVLTAGDTGEMVNKSVLTKDAPLADVLWGIDTTFLSRGLGEELFLPATIDTSTIDPAFLDAVPDKSVVPVDYGDVCVNYDKAALARAGVEPPVSFADLLKPDYKDMLVVENPASSSPGLAFLLGTIAAAQPVDTTGSVQSPGDAWKSYWRKLNDNGVRVVSGWTEAYENEFSAGGGNGTRPLVVSYASSPPAAVLYGPDPTATDAPTGVAEQTCFRQVEYAGVLAGTRRVKEANELLAFLIGPVVQRDMQLNMFVFPVNTEVGLVDELERFAAKPTNPASLPAGVIGSMRDGWIDEWSKLML